MWDAHYEKDLYDINVSKKKSAVTALGWEDEHHYVMAIGFGDGSLHIHDSRISPSDSRITRLSFDLKSPVVGLSVRTSNTDKERALLVGASECGVVSIWDPRQFDEPLFTMNVNDNQQPREGTIRQMSVHENGCLLACTVKLYDLRQRQQTSAECIAVIKHDEMEKFRPLSGISAVSMHKIRCAIAVGSSNGWVNVYGSPKSSF
ncbi:hypothetical protein WR25_21627 [Diploscapter pachys]|uniref:Anaphase-promoting complex subunit 4 WD40 domain-containing protein n=1 Tax=Diploscapter pachys TaxID=2018661 RepID=A0A2A2LUD6_9BILA|nr:hypothetical protein WR25_21627 [Diploscapter pachys]